MKRIGLLLLVLLLAGGMVACGAAICEDLQAYEALTQEMGGLSEYVFGLTLDIEIGAVLSEHLPQGENEDGETYAIYPARMEVNGTMSIEHGKALIRYTQWYSDDRTPERLDKLFTDEAMYLDLRSIIVENALGEARHVRASFAELEGGSFSDLISYLPKVLADVEAVSRADDVFTVTISGEVALEMLADVLGMLTQFAVIREDWSVMDDFAEILLSQLEQDEAADAEMMISTSQVEDGFQQDLRIYVPGLITMTMASSFMPQSVEHIGVPEAAFSWAEWHESTGRISYLALFCAGRRRVLIEGLEVVYDLEELNLVNHALLEGSLFEAVSYESVFGNTFLISEPIEGVGDPEGIITHDGLRLGYSSHPTSPLLQLDAVVFLEELVRFFGRGDNREIDPGLIRANSDRTIAFVPVRWLTLMEEGSRFFMAQVMPDSGEIILLEFWLWTIHADSLSEERYAAVLEIGQHIGIDFIALLDGESVFDIEEIDWFALG